MRQGNNTTITAATTLNAITARSRPSSSTLTAHPQHHNPLALHPVADISHVTTSPIIDTLRQSAASQQ